MALIKLLEDIKDAPLYNPEKFLRIMGRKHKFLFVAVSTRYVFRKLNFIYKLADNPQAMEQNEGDMESYKLVPDAFRQYFVEPLELLEDGRILKTYFIDGKTLDFFYNQRNPAIYNEICDKIEKIRIDLINLHGLRMIDLGDQNVMIDIHGQIKFVDVRLQRQTSENMNF